MTTPAERAPLDEQIIARLSLIGAGDYRLYIGSGPFDPLSVAMIEGDIRALLADRDALAERVTSAEAERDRANNDRDAAFRRSEQYRKLWEEMDALLSAENEAKVALRTELAAALAAMSADTADVVLALSVAQRERDAAVGDRNDGDALNAAMLTAIQSHRAEVAALTAEASRWYLADGSHVEMDPAQVIEKRKAAARDIATLAADNERLRTACEEILTAADDAVNHIRRGMSAAGNVSVEELSRAKLRLAGQRLRAALAPRETP